MKRSAIILVGMILAFGAVRAQLVPDTLSRYVIGSEGRSITVNGIGLSYTIGETVARTGVGNGGMFILNQGFQQPEQFEVVSIEDGITARMDCQLWPNPTSERLQVRLSADQLVELSAGIYNALGQETGIPVQELRVQAPVETTFSLEGLAEGTYYFTLKSEAGRVLKSFKVQKVD